MENSSEQIETDNTHILLRPPQADHELLLVLPGPGGSHLRLHGRPRYHLCALQEQRPAGWDDVTWLPQISYDVSL